MKLFITIIITIALIGFVGSVILNNYNSSKGISVTKDKSQNGLIKSQPQNIPQTIEIANDLDTPWGLAFLPDESILVTERKGTVRLIEKNNRGPGQIIATIKNVKEVGEGGLLGIDVHPNYVINNYVYVYYTYGNNGRNTFNRVSRFIYANRTFSDEEIIVDNIPGASNHNGGRIKFGPDKNLYIGTGDAQEPTKAQDVKSLAGKILRVTDEGKSVKGNTFNNLVFSYGHRNVQGLSWDSENRLWATEHGRSSPTGYDELNLIESGKNYGWPDVEGDRNTPPMIAPIRHSGPTTTWAPGGIAILNNKLYFVGLRGQSLYSAAIIKNGIDNFNQHFKGEFGRLRDIVMGPDNMLYITTSNRDGRGFPSSKDDKIMMINPEKL